MELDVVALPGHADAVRARAVFEREALPHRPSLLAAARRLTGRPDQAEDLVQETLLRALRSAHRYTPGTNARAWLYRILHRVRLDELRHRMRDPAPLALEGDGPRVEGSQKRLFSGGDGLEKALASVPEPYRSTLLLRELKELSYDELADTLGVPVGTIMSRLHRGRRLLREALGGRRP